MTVTPGTGACVMVGPVPSAQTPRVMAPAVAALVFAGKAPAFAAAAMDWQACPRPGGSVVACSPRPAGSWSPQPALGASAVVAAGRGAAVMAGYAPLLDTGKRVFPGAGARLMAGPAPTVVVAGGGGGGTTIDDTFTGGAAPLTGHQTDTGETWTGPAPNPANDAVLTGSGGVTGAVGAGAAVSLLAAAGRPVSVTVVATFEFGDDPINPDYAPAIGLFLRGKALATYPTTYESVAIQLGRGEFGGMDDFDIAVDVEDQDGLLDYHYAPWTPGSPNAEHTFVIAFAGDLVTVTADGVEVLSVTVAPGYDDALHADVGLAIYNSGTVYSRVTVNRLTVEVE